MRDGHEHFHQWTARDDNQEGGAVFKMHQGSRGVGGLDGLDGLGGLGRVDFLRINSFLDWCLEMMVNQVRDVIQPPPTLHSAGGIHKQPGYLVF